jgi:hypothetical protein
MGHIIFFLRTTQRLWARTVECGLPRVYLPRITGSIIIFTAATLAAQSPYSHFYVNSYTGIVYRQRSNTGIFLDES